ncbi:MAG: AIR synthase family protein [Aigarchaeota archaeon]|nr:AIR synthase family protein [Aigarchaeota archaeon]MDW7986343.1 AIR synthase family protein [Nitrososphaerota archaeon]
MRLGKIDRKLLEEVVYKKLGVERKDIVLGPSFGEDAGVIKSRSRYIVASCDPITGAVEKVGWLAVHINANDVAVCGGEPRWFSPIILLHEKSEREELEKIVNELHSACLELNVGVLTGHTEVAPGISHTVVCGFMMGPLVSSKPISSSGGRPGDVLVMSKSAGIEGTAILARDFRDRLRDKISSEILNRAERYFEKISIVKEALRLARRKIVSAMHDPTEGGVLGGVYEMAEASNTSFVIYEDKIPVSIETRSICEVLRCDPLRLISSGVLLAAIPKKYLRTATAYGLNVIGELRRKSEGNILVRVDKSEEKILTPIQDELWRLYEES